MKRNRAAGDLLPALGVAAYVAVVLTVDTLAARGARFVVDWRVLHWQARNGFDLFKFTTWLVIPAIWLLLSGRVDWGYLGFRRWRRVDWVLLAVAAVGGLLAVMAIPLFPSLRGTYGGMAQAPHEAKLAWLLFNVAWLVSWLPGWELLHRGLLLSYVDGRLSRYGWVLVPLAEGVYHLQKSIPEALGMVLFSVIATRWAMARRNLVLPFLAHLAVELALIAYLLLT
jgi:Type II CAAX prenyl endopeptidase Rce1-like